MLKFKQFESICYINTSEDQPIHEHDCPNCKFVGKDIARGPNEKRAENSGVDMYIHHGKDGRTLIRRYSSEPEAHSSWHEKYVGGVGDEKWHAVLKAAKKKGI